VFSTLASTMIRLDHPKNHLALLAVVVLRSAGQETRLPAGWALRKLLALVDVNVSSLRRGHGNLLRSVPSLTDELGRESTLAAHRRFLLLTDTIFLPRGVPQQVWARPSGG